MKARDFGFLLAGLVVGAIGCAAVLISYPSPTPAPKPVVVQAPAPPQDTASTEIPDASGLGGNVYLTGQVHKEGVVEIRPNETLTVSQALALDGGVAGLADARNVKLLRQRADGTSQVIPVDLKLSDSGYVKDPTVEPGDLINVPEKEINR
jgi:protein involved in polysaccharide export with SLBB domain